MPVEHVTGSERAALEHQFGPLQQVGDRGDLVRVPDEISKEHRDVDRNGNLNAVTKDEDAAHDAARRPVRTDVPSKAKGEEDEKPSRKRASK